MAPRLHILVCAIWFYVLFNINVQGDPNPEFPTIIDIEIESYTTEVEVTDSIQLNTGYASEYYDGISDVGRVELVMNGEITNVYYNNQNNEILEVNATTCTAWEIDESEYDFTAIFYGWLNKKPLIIGPSAPLFYAQSRRSNIKYEGIVDVRNIPCEHFTLEIAGKGENVILNYYFAQKNWTTPYQYEGLRIPIRIHAFGNSSERAEKADTTVPIDIYTDFAYYKPTIDYDLDLQPSVGLGCSMRSKSDTFPTIPKTFQYSAEVVDLLDESEHSDVDVRIEKVWYDGLRNIGRFDVKNKTFSSSSFQDYNTGVMYEYAKEDNCKVKRLMNAFFQNYDDEMVGSMKDEREVLNLDGDFYNMGQTHIRGINSDVYESVTKDVVYNGEKLHRLVVTAYFIQDYTKVGVYGEEESRIPIVILLTGWKSAKTMALKLQYNIFAFNDVIWPEMYVDFGIEECYAKPEDKAFFVLTLETPLKFIEMLQDQDDSVVHQLRALIVKHAEIPAWRIPALKISYKATGVFATGTMVERPLRLLQFDHFDSGGNTTKENLVAAVAAKTLEDCASSCIEYEEPCNGFFFCKAACFLKIPDGGEELSIGQCDEYLRAESDFTNFRNLPLKKSLENLENVILNQSLNITISSKNRVEMIQVSNVIIGGPYTSVNTGDKLYGENSVH